MIQINGNNNGNYSETYEADAFICSMFQFLVPCLNFREATRAGLETLIWDPALAEHLQHHIDLTNRPRTTITGLLVRSSLQLNQVTLASVHNFMSLNYLSETSAWPFLISVTGGTSVIYFRSPFSNRRTFFVVGSFSLHDIAFTSARLDWTGCENRLQPSMLVRRSYEIPISQKFYFNS